MKVITTGALCLSLVVAPIERPKANTVVLGICIIAVTTVVAAGVVVMIKSCKPKYYCLWDMTDPARGYWVGTATRTELIANDWSVSSGPYDSVEAASNHCPPPTNAPPSKTISMVVGGSATSNYTPSWIHIEQSTNLVDWVEVAKFAEEPTNFSWSTTNSAAMPCAFYRAWY